VNQTERRVNSGDPIVAKNAIDPYQLKSRLGRVKQSPQIESFFPDSRLLRNVSEQLNSGDKFGPYGAKP
jgi:hypothetical protein